MINVDIDGEFYRNDILRLLQIIGFYRHEVKRTESGMVNEYKYYSPLLSEKHYTMVTYQSHKSNDVDFRLYVHTNKNGAYCSSPFQISTYSKHNRILILKSLTNIFEKELICYTRENKLKELLCE